MSAQKEEIALKIQGTGVPVTNHDASVDFLTEIQELTVDHLFSMQVHAYAIVGGAPKLTLLVSNTNVAADFVPFNADFKDIDISILDNRIKSSKDLPFRFIRWQYVAAAATGSFSMNMVEMEDH